MKRLLSSPASEAVFPSSASFLSLICLFLSSIIFFLASSLALAASEVGVDFFPEDEFPLRRGMLGLGEPPLEDFRDWKRREGNRRGSRQKNERKLNFKPSLFPGIGRPGKKCHEKWSKKVEMEKKVELMVQLNKVTVTVPRNWGPWRENSTKIEKNVERRRKR